MLIRKLIFSIKKSTIHESTTTQEKIKMTLFCSFFLLFFFLSKVVFRGNVVWRTSKNSCLTRTYFCPFLWENADFVMVLLNRKKKPFKMEGEKKFIYNRTEQIQNQMQPTPEKGWRMYWPNWVIFVLFLFYIKSD